MAKHPAPADGTATLKSVREEIARQQLGWEAAKTALSDAKIAEAAEHFGLAIEPERLAATAQKVEADELFWGLMGTLAPPPAIDWRNNNGDYVKTPRDQGRCQSCVAFAVVGAIEANLRIACRNPNHDIALSETDLFSCGCGPCCSRGWYPDQALRHCQTQGVAALAQVPYRPHDVMCQTGIALRTRITGWKQLTTRSSIKQAVFEQGPCVYGMVVYDDFLRFYRGGVYRHAAGRRLGLHAILIVGYDDSQQCWICKNSWGTDWGDRGFFRVHYDDICLMGPGYAFPAFSVTVPCPVAPAPPVTPTPPVVTPPASTCTQYVPVLKDVIRAGWADPALKQYLGYWVCGVGQQPAANPAYEPLTNQVRTIMRACPSYLPWFRDNLLK